MREAFSVYERRLRSGKRVFYFQVYDEDGKRGCGHSTGKGSRTAARNYCHVLLREGRLLERVREVPLFEEFAKGWWVWDSCPYLKMRAARREITHSYADRARRQLRMHLLPYFGKMRLDKISEYDVDAWLTSFSGKGFKNTSANQYFGVLRIMLGEALRKKLIRSNPALLLQELKDDGGEISILTPEEVKLLFPAVWGDVWDSWVPYVANKLAACTGMRLGEVLGVRGEFVFDDYIHVCGQYGQYGYTDTKTHEARNVPFPSAMGKDLIQLKKINGNGYLFTNDGGVLPINRKAIYESLYAALEAIGIGEDERSARKVSFHGWRHFFNTTLRMANVADSKVMSVTGHKSIRMTEHYTHFDSREFGEVRKIQEDLLLAGAGAESGAVDQGVAEGSTSGAVAAGGKAAGRVGKARVAGGAGKRK